MKTISFNKKCFLKKLNTFVREQWVFSAFVFAIVQSQCLFSDSAVFWPQRRKTEHWTSLVRNFFNHRHLGYWRKNEECPRNTFLGNVSNSVLPFEIFVKFDKPSKFGTYFYATIWYIGTLKVHFSQNNVTYTCQSIRLPIAPCQ